MTETATHVAGLVSRAQTLIDEVSDRAIIGICGPPGSGKSTLAATIADHLGPTAVVFSMDGFHLHDGELARLRLSQIKGAPPTFDVEGYVATLARVRRASSTPVYAPVFDRSRELAIAGAISIRPEHRLVITEGNYLLLDAPGWRDIATYLDDTWYVDTAEDLRQQRLFERHVEHGRSPDQAREWMARSDEANTRLITETRDSANLRISAW